MKRAVSVPKSPEKHKMRQKAGSFYRIKNKEQRNKYRAQSWFGLWGLADWIHGVSGQAEHLQGPES